MRIRQKIFNIFLILVSMLYITMVFNFLFKEKDGVWYNCLYANTEKAVEACYGKQK